MKEQIKQALDKATPGPWERMNGRDIFTKNGATNREGVTADTNDGWHIADCLVGWTNVDGEECELSWDERQANANLIANSPTWLRWQNERIEDLEQALEQSLRQWANYANEQRMDDISASDDLEGREYQRIRALLAVMECDT